MALQGLPYPENVCLWGMALMDKCTGQAIAGPTNGFLCTNIQELTIEPSYTGGEKQSKEDGCGRICRTKLTKRCFESAAGTLKACLFNEEMSTLFNGGALYTNAGGFTAGGTGGQANCEEIRVWIQIVEELDYGTDCEATATAGLPLYRVHVFPSGLFRPKLMPFKKGYREFEAELADFVAIKPADGYRGPFGDLPADFFTQIPDAKTDWHYWYDTNTLPAAAAACDQLIPVV